MKKLILILIFCICGTAYAVDTKLTGLTVLASADCSDNELIYVVDEPNGVPVSRKIARYEFLLGWAGSANITTLGTIATGTWQGTDVGVLYGGTGASSLNDLITLTTHTTGNYVASITNGAGITGGDGGSEGAGLTLAATLGTAIDTSEITDGTIAFADIDNTITLAGNPAFAASEAWFGTTGIIFEGLTPDTIEGLLTVTDPTASDKTWTLPNTTGTILLDADIGSSVQAYDATLSDIADGTILEDLVNTANPWAANEITEADPLSLLTAGTDNVKDTHVDWGSGAGQVNLADVPGGISGANIWDFGGATSFEIPNAESADATLTALGQMHIRGDEDRISSHFGAGGEIAGEATLSYVKPFSITLDPGSWYDSNSVVPIIKIHSKLFPNGIIIDYIEVDCLLNPDVEMDLDLCYANDWDDVADPNIIDVLDTTVGKFSEDTDANINGGAAIAAGSVLYLRFGADPEGTCTALNVLIAYHSEED